MKAPLTFALACWARLDAMKADRPVPMLAAARAVPHPSPLKVWTLPPTLAADLHRIAGRAVRAPLSDFGRFA